VPSLIIFANPIAGRGKGRAIARRLATRLSRDGYTAHTILERADASDVSERARDATAAIVIGGDGTLRGVARHLYATLRGRIPPLLVVPMGTANLMGVHLGLQWNDAALEDQVSAALARHQILELDAARANGDLFLLMAGVGVDARVVHELDRLRSGPIDLTSYVLPAALALGFYDYPPLEVTLDGKSIFASRPAMAFVGNIREYGTGFPILPHARPDDGLLDVCVLPCQSRAQVLKLILCAAAGEHLQEEGVIYAKGKHVRIQSPREVPIQVDGEAAGHTPVEIDLLPTRIPFIVPV
jgi:diacylglycerol kinase (ATP)